MSLVDQLYADHLAKQTPTGAYRSTAVPGDSNPLRDLLHAQALISSAIHALSKQSVTASTQRGHPGDVDTLGRTSEGLAKRLHDQALAADVAWSAKRGDYPAPSDWCVHVTPAAWANPQAENLRAYGIGDVPHESRHPMAAEADRLSAEGLV